MRITRVIRDIPREDIVAGSEVSNLREILAQELKQRKLRCWCIRCREPRGKDMPKKLYLFRQDYEASEGKEIFLSFEDKKRNNLYALLRLRIPSQYFSGKPHFIKVLQGAALIRELHVYGRLVPLNKESKEAVQHRGLGKQLIQEAEKISQKEFGIKKIAIISGVGVRDYYRKLGYRLQDTYMIKNM